MVADGGVLDPDPAAGIQTRGHIRAENDGEGIAMSASTATVGPPRQRGAGSYAWPIGFAVAIVLVFVFYRYWLPNIANSGEKFVGDWFPIGTINLCIIWAIMAIGLNIVVGYAGLLDLGYVAFWAIGSYVGAWLMSTFWYQIKKGFHLGSTSTVASQPGIHINFWVVLLIGGIVCGVFGILLGAPTLRLRGDYLAIVTLGFG